MTKVHSKRVPSKLHTKIKHKIIGYYYSATWRNVFRSGRLHSLWYVDLYSGPGKCVSDEIEKEKETELPTRLGEKTWYSPFFKLMSHVRKYAKDDFDFNCVFNDINEDYIIQLEKRIEKKGFSEYAYHFHSKDANHFYKKALEMIGKPNRPSLFYLDPTNHAQLEFSTIEGITDFKSKSDRRPELIINLMIFSILMAIRRCLSNQKCSEEDLNSINKALGTKFSVDELREIYENDLYTPKQFLDIYLSKLEDKGYYCKSYLIRTIDSNSPLYYLIFATTSDKASSMMDNIDSRIKELTKGWSKEMKDVIKPVINRDEAQTTLPGID